MALAPFGYQQAPVSLYEVGPRDGLQNENKTVDTTHKLNYVLALIRSGLTRIEVTSFVNPKWIPQLADAEALCLQLAHALPSLAGLRLSGLVPNVKGYLRLKPTLLNEVGIVLSASSTHHQKNMNRKVEESLHEYRDLMAMAKADKRFVRAYISTAFFCPYEGAIAPSCVIDLALQLHALGADEISIGDTIGAATPYQVVHLCEQLDKQLGLADVALHFHDTKGMAIANILAGYHMGVRTFDASSGGLGGCPYAPSATGNVATEDVVYLFKGMGVYTGVDLQALCQASLSLAPLVSQSLSSHVLKSLPLI